MASNNPTFESGFFENLEGLQNVSEMVETSETSDVLKDKQLSESATGGDIIQVKFPYKYHGTNGNRGSKKLLFLPPTAIALVSSLCCYD